MRRASIALAAVLLAAGCGTSTTSGATPMTPALPGTATAATAAATATADASDALAAGPKHNAADVEFAQALIPHHRQGIALASAAAKNSQARTLAEAIIVTQQDEVVRMTAWLQTWGATPPASAAPSPAPADPIPALITHQEDAITIAQQEQANGTNLTALAFAKQIIESRAGQTTQLRTYLQ